MGTSAQVGNTPVLSMGSSKPKGAPCCSHLANVSASGSSVCSAQPCKIAALIGVWASTVFGGSPSGWKSTIIALSNFAMASGSRGLTSSRPLMMSSAVFLRWGNFDTPVSISSLTVSPRVCDNGSLRMDWAGFLMPPNAWSSSICFADSSSPGPL